MHMLLTVEDSNILALKCNKYFWVKLCTPLKGSIGSSETQKDISVKGCLGHMWILV